MACIKINIGCKYLAVLGLFLVKCVFFRARPPPTKLNPSDVYAVTRGTWGSRPPVVMPAAEFCNFGCLECSRMAYCAPFYPPPPHPPTNKICVSEPKIQIEHKKTILGYFSSLHKKKILRQSWTEYIGTRQKRMKN